MFWEDDIEFQLHNISCANKTVYLICLNQKRELLIQYCGKWSLPYRILAYDDDTIELSKFFLLPSDRLLKPPQLISNDQSNIYFQIEIDVNQTEIDGNYLNLLSISNGKTIKFIRYSRLIELSLFLQHRQILTKVYDPYKLQLLIDLDKTLLDSYIISNNKYSNIFELLNKYIIDDNHPLIINNILPDTILLDGLNSAFAGLPRYVWLRPHVRYFLDLISNLTQLHFWTAGNRPCQGKILNELKLSHFARNIFYSESCCKPLNDIWYKSVEYLNKLLQDKGEKPFDLNRVLLIDDNPVNQLSNVNNCLLVDEWNLSTITSVTGLSNRFKDSVLLYLIIYLKDMTDCLIHENGSVPMLLNRSSHQIKI